MSGMFWRHPLLTVLTIAYLVFVLWITLGTSPYGSDTASLLDRALIWFANHNATSWITFSVIERLANVALFVPVGALFLLLFGHRFWYLAILFSIGLSVAIETIQGLWLATRVADPIDVVTNGTGSVIGVALAAMLTWRTERQHRLIREQEKELAAARDEIARLSSPAHSRRASRPQ